MNTSLLNNRTKFGAKIFTRYYVITFYVLGHFFSRTLYINVPLLNFKIRCVSKYTAASRGSSCGNTAFLSVNPNEVILTIILTEDEGKVHQLAEKAALRKIQDRIPRPSTQTKYKSETFIYLFAA